MSDEFPVVQIYTDGSCRPNPGPGGWGAVIINSQQKHRTLKGCEQDTTNNRMELTAALRAMQSLERPHRIELHTDSKYLKDGITQWITNWRRRDWTSVTGESVRNRDLWESLSQEIERHQVNWNWVKGHGTDRWNNLADELAGSGAARPALPLNDENSVHIFLGITWRQSILAGAWTGVLRYRHHYRIIGGTREGGTGNSLHIVSVVEALKALKRQLPVHVYTTSGYLREGVAAWLNKWCRHNWLTSEGGEVSNRSEWQALKTLLDSYSVTFHLIDKAEPPCHMTEAKLLAQEFLAAGSMPDKG